MFSHVTESLLQSFLRRAQVLFAGDRVPSQLPYAASDAFGRLRMSAPETIFDSKQLYDNLPLFYDDQAVSGAGTSSTYSSARASSLLGVSANTAGKRVRQTFRRFNYQPGKSQEIMLTFVGNNAGAGIITEVTYGDDDNGIGYTRINGVDYLFLRSALSGTTTLVELTNGNLWTSKFPDINFTKAQILIIDFEWLGVGTVRVGFVVDGVIWYFHAFNHANKITSVYMSTPNLPIRYSIENDGTGAAASLEQICSVVISEGGTQATGLTLAGSRGNSTIATPAENVWYPLMSGRLKSTHFGVTIQPTDIFVVADGATDFEIGLFYEPSIAEPDAASWVPVLNSAIEYDISRTVTNIVSGGTLLNVALTSQTNQARGVSVTFRNRLTLGAFIDGTPTELVVAVRRVSGGTTSRAFLAAVNWAELL